MWIFYVFLVGYFIYTILPNYFYNAVFNRPTFKNWNDEKKAKWVDRINWIIDFCVFFFFTTWTIFKVFCESLANLNMWDVRWGVIFMLLLWLNPINTYTGGVKVLFTFGKLSHLLLRPVKSLL